MMAKKSCESAVTIDANEADTHICLGLIDNGTGQYADAAEQYRLALRLEPANDNAIRGLASAYQHLGKSAEAEETYKSAIATRPSYWLGYNELGGLYMTMGRYQEAAEMFTQATKRAPDSFRGYSNLGGAYVALNRYSEAVGELRHSIDIRPTYAAYSNLGTALFMLRQYAGAAESYRAALALSDKDYVVWGNLAYAYRYVGRQEDAKSAFEKAIALALVGLEVNALDAVIHADLSTYYAATGNRGDALMHLKKALEESKYQDPELIFDAALVYHDFGDRDHTMEWLGKALAAGYSPTVALNSPPLDDLHQDPQFQSIIAKAGPSRQNLP